MCLLYYACFTLRRLLMAITIIFIDTFPMMQLIIFNQSSVLTIIFLGWSKPFKLTFINNLELFNELAILAHTYMLVLFTDINDDGIFKAKLGWVIVGMTGLVFLVNMACIIGFILTNLIKIAVIKVR